MPVLAYIVAWIVCSTIAGWIATRIMGTKATFLGVLWCGSIGFIIGGLLVMALSNGSVSLFSVEGILASIVGATIFIAFMNRLKEKRQISRKQASRSTSGDTN